MERPPPPPFAVAAEAPQCNAGSRADADVALVRLLQLASPALPVGAFAYSQGLEWAVGAGDVRDEASARRWIEAVLERSIASCELVFLAHLFDAVAEGDGLATARLDAEFLATRDTLELRSEIVQTGGALRKLLGELDLAPPDPATFPSSEMSLPAAFALAAVRLAVPRHAALTAYAWSWLENQVLAAVKLVPLGQASGQRILLALGAQLPPAVARAAATPLAGIGNALPGLAIASARHETQYTRLFRS